MKKNPLEWTVFAASFALIVATVVVLIYADITSAHRPPVIVVAVGTPVAQAGAYAVPLDVANEGDTTAQAVRIEVALSGSGVEERAAVEVAFVPHGSRRRAWVTFSTNPAGSTLKARVVGYEEP
jgi:uncharacterized protein (TIGR02588 family)